MADSPSGSTILPTGVDHLKEKVCHKLERRSFLFLFILLSQRYCYDSRSSSKSYGTLLQIATGAAH